MPEEYFYGGCLWWDCRMLLPWEGSWPGSDLNHNWLIATSKWPCPVLISIPMLKNRPVAITKCKPIEQADKGALSTSHINHGLPV